MWDTYYFRTIQTLKSENGSENGGSLFGRGREVDTFSAATSLWYALAVRPRHERRVSLVLRSKGYREFLPMYHARRRWTDRVAEIELPLFPGYVFCQFDPGDRRVPIVTTPGVIRIVGGPNGPVAVDEIEMATVRAVVDSGIAAQPWPYLATGQAVRIQHGALAGIEGILLEVKGRRRLIVSVTLLQRSIHVDIDSALVVPVRPVWRSVPGAAIHKGAA